MSLHIRRLIGFLLGLILTVFTLILAGTILLFNPNPPKGHDMLIGVYQPNSSGSYNQIDDFARLIGFTPRIVSYYSDFATPFNKVFATQAQSEGTTVLVQWQPRGTTNAAIAAGTKDAFIRQFAQDIASDDRQVILSYGQEMNGNWYPWGFHNDTAANYIAAYLHIWNIFQAQQVHNVTWLWGPNIQYSGGPPLSAWYPGDAYVDWVGLDGYFGYATDTFTTLFGPSINELRTFTKKPLLIAETGVTGEHLVPAR